MAQFVIISPASCDIHALLLSDDDDYYYYYNLHISTDHLYFAGATNTHILDTARCNACVVRAHSWRVRSGRLATVVY